MEKQSSSFNNGGSGDISFLSLLMADDTITTQTQNNEVLLQDNYQLPPLPLSSFHSTTTPTQFLSPDYNTTTTSLIFQTPNYFPAFNLITSPPSLPDYKIPKLEPTCQDNLYSPSSSSSMMMMMNQEFPAGGLPELLSLDDDLQVKKAKKARNSRQRKSESICRLGKLLPGSHPRRLSATEVLEETHKYIRFLQAQVAVLRSMPTESRISGVGKGASVTAELGRLSRQQVLQVVVNSPAAQAMMAEKGWCVVSAEQVVLMKKIETRKKLIQRLLEHLPL